MRLGYRERLVGSAAAEQWQRLHSATHLGGIDDAHVHAGIAGVVQEGRVEGTAHGLVATEGEGNVGHTAAAAV